MKWRATIHGDEITGLIATADGRTIWIADGAECRMIVVKASSYREACKLAYAECAAHELVYDAEPVEELAYDVSTTAGCTCGEAYGERMANLPKCRYCVDGTQ